jgi:hypothetical protein
MNKKVERIANVVIDNLDVFMKFYKANIFSLFAWSEQSIAALI